MVVKMDKKTFWIIAGVGLAVLVLLVVWQTAQINALASGTETVRAVTSAASASSGMVGGC